MVQIPNRNSKLDPKFVGPRLVVKQLHGNKFDILDPWLTPSRRQWTLAVS